MTRGASVVTLLAVAGSIFQIGRALAALVLLVAAGLALAEPPADETAALSRATPLAPPAALAPPAPRLCPETGDVIAVLTRKRELWLCIDGAPAARFEVALGQGGLDKRQKGDRRTPLGTYELGTPRLSGTLRNLHPHRLSHPGAGSPGADRRRRRDPRPPRKLPEPEYPTTAFDWTLGCVATGTDADIAGSSRPSSGSGSRCSWSAEAPVTPPCSAPACGSPPAPG